jgi:type IV pilus assembly protein PilY1
MSNAQQPLSRTAPASRSMRLGATCGRLLLLLAIAAMPLTAHALCADQSVNHALSYSWNWQYISESQLPTLSDVTATSGFAGSNCSVQFRGSPHLLRYRRCNAGTASLTGPAASCLDSPSAISQVPLFVSASIEPNILFVLDDSGSMQWEFMPDEQMYFTTFTFPRPANPYGGSTYTNQVPSFDDANIHNVFSRSPQNNAAFYNPLLTYRPWVDANNQSWADANPSAALYNPADSSKGSLDLTRQANQSAYWFTNSANHDPAQAFYRCGGDCSLDFWPLTFYRYKGSGDRHAPYNYIKYQIRGANGYRTDLDGGVETSVGLFDWTDAAGEVVVSRSLLQERQNFANWFSYYRSRILAARAGVGRAFAPQKHNMRVGFGAINHTTTGVDGVSSGTLISGLRQFSGVDRVSFFDQLYTHEIPAAGTPLRRSLNEAGGYYSSADNRGPWGHAPGSNDATAHLQCRQSYTILMTDGYWNGDPAASPAARANTDGTHGPSHSGPDGQAFSYEALSPFSDNHSDTLADVAMQYWKQDLRGDLENRVPVSTTNPAFWQHMVTFGVGLGVTGSIAPDSAFAAIQSGAAIDWPSPSVTGGSENIDDLLHAGVNSRGGFFSAADPDAFASKLTETLASIVERTRSSATRISNNSVFLDIGSRVFQAGFDSSDWSGWLHAYLPGLDAAGQLTNTLEWRAEAQLPAHDQRNILSHEGGNGNGHGIAFSWGAGGLSDAQKAQLNDSEALLDFLRGQRDEEGGNYRVRGGVMGDIIGSDPLYSHQEHYGHHLLGGIEGDSYNAYVQAKRQRTPLLYVGANDGMLHAFDATNGTEVFAYVPAAVYPHLAELAAQDYQHRYYVDGGLHVSDAYINGGWKTILLGTLGAGGKGVFALDVSNPGSMDSSRVLWEFSDADLGYPYGKPVIARLRNGTWAAIFANGYDSADGRAILYILDVASGELIAKVDVGVAGDNGLSAPAFVYESGEAGRYASAIYAGDLLGNLWKFQMSGPCNQAGCDWDVAFSQGNDRLPLFSARSGSDQAQPITTAVDLRQHDQGGYLLLFGTGRFLSADDPEDLSVQTVYGIWDNGERISATDRSVLQQQTIDHQVALNDSLVRGLSNAQVSWWDDQGNDRRGWYLDLLPPDGTPLGERVIRPVEVWFDRLRVSSYIPSADPCSASGNSWYMEIGIMTGGRLGEAVFDLDNDAGFDWIPLEDGSLIPVSGFRYGGAGAPTAVGDHLIVDPDEVAEGYFSGIGRIQGRQTWREIP